MQAHFSLNVGYQCVTPYMSHNMSQMAALTPFSFSGVEQIFGDQKSDIKQYCDDTYKVT